MLGFTEAGVKPFPAQPASHFETFGVRFLNVEDEDVEIGVSFTHALVAPNSDSAQTLFG